jgi:hypothetical protein
MSVGCSELVVFDMKKHFGLNLARQSYYHLVEGNGTFF